MLQDLLLQRKYLYKCLYLLNYTIQIFDGKKCDTEFESIDLVKQLQPGFDICICNHSTKL